MLFPITVCTTTSLMFTSTNVSMVSRSTLLARSAIITVNFSDNRQRLYQHYWASCFLLNQMPKMKKKADEYYCLIAALFFPWSAKRAPKRRDQSWEEFVKTNEHRICCPRAFCDTSITSVFSTKLKTKRVFISCNYANNKKLPRIVGILTITPHSLTLMNLTPSPTMTITKLISPPISRTLLPIQFLKPNKKDDGFVISIAILEKPANLDTSSPSKRRRIT